MADVARRAEVSIKTVSRVVNGEAGVSPATTARVRAIIDDLGFQRHAGATMLRTGRSDRIGLVVEDLANPFYAQLAAGIEREARLRQHLLMSTSSQQSAAERGRAGRRAVASAWRAWWSSRSRPSRRRLCAPRLARCPSSAWTGPSRTSVSTRCSATTTVGCAAPWSTWPPIGTSGSASSATTSRSGPPASARPASPPRRPPWVSARPAAVPRRSLRRWGGRRPAAAMDPSRDPVTAIITGNNRVTLAVLHAMREAGNLCRSAGYDRGLRVGRRRRPSGAQAAPSQDPMVLGERAVQQIFARLAVGAGEPTTVIVPTRLIVRGSGKAAHGGGRRGGLMAHGQVPSAPLTRRIVGLALLFIASGTTHLVRPQVFEPIVPRALPARRELVYVSGVAELVCAAGLLAPDTVGGGLGLRRAPRRGVPGERPDDLWPRPSAGGAARTTPSGRPSSRGRSRGCRCSGHWSGSP